MSARRPSLKPRHVQILTLTGQGRSIKEMAAELSLSVQTIKTYRPDITHILGGRTFPHALAIWARRQAMVDLAETLVRISAHADTSQVTGMVLVGIAADLLRETETQLPVKPGHGGA